jgi:hypothetical protein
MGSAMPHFRFMTGATRYRIEARDRDEAIQTAFEALNPTEEMKAVILSTLYSEEDAKAFVGTDNRAEGSNENDDPDAT